MKKRFFYIGILIVLCSCSSPRSKEENSKMAIKINLKFDPHSLDPRKVRSTHSMTLMKIFFEGLTREGKNEKTEYALARSVDISEDLKKYTFHLRPSEWSNGSPLTAHDFVYTWKKILDPHFIADNAFQLYVIKNGKKIKEGKLPLDKLGVRAIDKLTLEVELENPTPYFLELTAFPIFFPINAKLDEQNPNWSNSVSTYVCNGPFKLKEWRHQDQITAEKNKTYWDAKTVKISSIEMLMVQEETELKMYEQQSLDWVGSPLSILPLDALPSLKEHGNVLKKPILGTSFLRLNVHKMPLNNAFIRKALALAINRKEIVDHVAAEQIPATGLVPLSMGLQEEPYFHDGDIEEARHLFEEGLKQSRLSLNELPEMTLMYVSLERNHLVAQVIQEQWRKAFGLKVTLEAIEAKVYYDRIGKLDYQIASGSWTADFNDPVNFLEVFKYKTASTNNTGWESKKYADLLDDSLKTFDFDKRKALLVESEKILIDQMPIIPIFYFNMLYIKNEHLKEVVVSSLGTLDFKWAYLDNAP